VWCEDENETIRTDRNGTHEQVGENETGGTLAAVPSASLVLTHVSEAGRSDTGHPLAGLSYARGNDVHAHAHAHVLNQINV
jgi:hypothetical protein